VEGNGGDDFTLTFPAADAMYLVYAFGSLLLAPATDASLRGSASEPAL